MKLTDSLVEKLVEKYDNQIKKGDVEAQDKKESLKDFYKDWTTSRHLSDRKTPAMGSIADDYAMQRLYKLRDKHSEEWPDNALEGGVFQNLPKTPGSKK